MKEKLKKALALRQKMHFEGEGLVKAAVLVPVFCKDGEYHLLFTKRSDLVPSHKGQISFPGGAYNEADSSLVATALRESWEEIGLKTEDVEILGELDDTPTRASGFNISPFVGFIPYPYEFSLNRFEIDEIFSVPVSDLLYKTNKKEDYYTFGNEVFVNYSYEHGGRIIWGATARILHQFLEVWELASGTQH